MKWEEKLNPSFTSCVCHFGLFIQGYSAKNELTYEKRKRLSPVICYISKFPQDGRISEYFKEWTCIGG